MFESRNSPKKNGLFSAKCSASSLYSGSADHNPTQELMFKLTLSTAFPVDAHDGEPKRAGHSNSASIVVVPRDFLRADTVS